MKKPIPILVAMLLAVPVFGESTTPAAPAVLALAPEDALSIIYLAKPSDIFSHPIWAISEANEDPILADFLENTAGTFSGPTMVAMCGTPQNPLGWRFEFAIRPDDGVEAFYAKLEDAWLPAVAGAAVQPAPRLERSGDFRILRLPAPLGIGLFLADKDGVVYGSSRITDVTTWTSGEALPPRFVDGADARKLPADQLAGTDALFYMNFRPVMPLATVELDRVFPGLAASLGLDKLEFGALTASWSRTGPQVDVVFGLPADAGMLELLASRNSPLDIAGLVPADYSTFVRATMTTAADDLERLNAILDTIDPAVVAEFRTECAEFRQEYGFDPLSDFAANLVDEWILAVKVQADGGFVPLIAARLGDAEKFNRQADLLIRGFKLEVSTTPVEGGVIYSAAPESGVRFAWTAVGDHLLMSNSVESIQEAIEARTAGRTLLTAPALTSVTPRLPAESSRLFFANLSELARLALHEANNDPDVAALLEPLQKLTEANAGAALSVSRGDGVLSLRLAASPSADESVRATAWHSIGQSIACDRAYSRRLVSAANIRGLITACLIYANDHKGAWPESLGVLIESGDIAPEMLRNPYKGGCDNSGESFYLYRNGTGLAPEDVVICERELQDGGGNFGFVDGHVEWLDGDRARELHALIRSAQH